MDIEKWNDSSFGWNGIKGVYAICTFDENKKIIVHYIGSSLNIGNRLANTNHPYRILFNKNLFPFVKYYENEDYKQIEIEMIKKYKPALNIQHNGKG